jgi:hypothetical protein
MAIVIALPPNSAMVAAFYLQNCNVFEPVDGEKNYFTLGWDVERR